MLDYFPDRVPIYFQRWIMVTFILYYTLSSIMTLSKIGVIGVKNQDNSSYSDFVLNHWQKSYWAITAQKKISAWEKFSEKKVQHVNTEFIMKNANE